MAEAAAVIGLIASITSLVEVSVKIISRVREYNAHNTNVPKTFCSLADRLPLLTQTLKRIQAGAQANHVANDTAKDLTVLVNNILEQVKLVGQSLEGIITAPNTSRFDRVLIGLKSLAKDEKVKQAVEKIHHGIDILVLHQTTSTAEVSDHILKELSRLSLQNISSQQSVPTLAAQQAFGLCLGQAPLIEPDAFIGRHAELQQLHEWLSQSHNAQVQRVVSIVGMGGLGKTQLSLAYAREYGHEYTSVFWFSAKDKTSLRQSMSALSALIFSDNIVAAVNADEETTQVEKVRRWFSEAWNDQWLIIFDNYDDPSLPNIRSQTGFDIRQFFPTRLQGSILITTRSSKLTFSKLLTLQKVQDLDTCVTVLSQRSRRDMAKDQDSQQLAARLDGLPLALAVAGTYLAQVNASCTEYLNLYETAWNDLHGSDAEELMEYENRTLSSTWTISLDQIRHQDADAAELLRFFGYLNNDDIWYELIKTGVDNGPSWLGRLTASRIRFDRAMSKLGDYSLVEAKEGSYRVHPCLHDWIVQHLNIPLSEALFVTTIICLRKHIPDPQDLQYSIMTRRLIKHVKSTQHQRFANLWENNASNQIILDASQCFGRLCRHLCEFDSAEKIYTWTLAGRERTLGVDHTLTLDTVNNLGSLYCDQGKLDKAEGMFLRALAGKEKILGIDDTLTLNTVDNLGILYYNQGKPDKAEGMFLRALAGREKILGQDHSLTLDTVNNLGILYRGQGKLDKAEEMYLQALAGKEKIQGQNHYSTLRTVNNLGNLYRDQRKLDEAEELYERALAGKEKILGRDHTSTLETVNNLGNLYRDQGKLDEAEEMYRRALAGREKALGRDHHSTLQTVNNLGLLYTDQGKLNEAEEMCSRAVAGKEKALGWDHHSTLQSLNNLGRLYRDQGKISEAEEMYLRALVGREKVLGSDHISTLQTVYNLGLLYTEQRKLEKAEKMYLRALAGREKVLVQDHPSIIRTAHNLALLYENQGKLDKAEEMYLRTLAGKEKLLGQNHSSTLDIVYALGLLYADQGRLEEAEAMYRRVLNGFEACVGSDHPATQTVGQKLKLLRKRQQNDQTISSEQR